MPGLSGNNPTCADRLDTNWQKTPASTSFRAGDFRPSRRFEGGPSRGSFYLPGGDGCGRVIKQLFVCETIAS
jgi:hypothetical protein